MVQRVFVKVVGFSDVERHALNTLFRLSEQRHTVYALWLPEAPEPPQLVLVDGASYEAQFELGSPSTPAEARLVWVGEGPPERTWRQFGRPIAWPEVVRAMDELFAPPVDLDFDLGLEEADSPATRPPLPEEHPRRALIASADRDQRLYLRARLALSGLNFADEADTGARALELVRGQAYDVAWIDFDLPDVDGWAFMQTLGEVRPAIPHLLFSKPQASIPERLKAWTRGAKGLFGQPPHPGKLQALLDKV